MSYFDEPQTPEPIFRDCPECLGNPFEMVNCNMCDGAGSIEIDREDLRDEAADLKHDENNNN